MILIEKVKIGLWRKRTRYDLTVDGVFIGQYETKREAERVGLDHEEYSKRMDAWASEGIDE